MPVDFDCSMEYFSSSSPHTESCQSSSQLFGPSKKPSSVTRFHMMSLLTFYHRPETGNSSALHISAVGPSAGPHRCCGLIWEIQWLHSTSPPSSSNSEF